MVLEMLKTWLLACLIQFENALYAGSNNWNTGAQIWKTQDGTHWSQVNVDGYGDSNNNYVWGGAVFKGSLYLSASENYANGGEIWQMLKQVYLPLVIR